MEGPRLKKRRGVKRVDRDGDAWIARDINGNDYPEDGYRWNTRSGAWHAAYEADFLPNPIQERT